MASGARAKRISVLSYPALSAYALFFDSRRLCKPTRIRFWERKRVCSMAHSAPSQRVRHIPYVTRPFTAYE